MSEGAKAPWERWENEPIPPSWGGIVVYQSHSFLMKEAFAAGFAAGLADALAALEQEAAKLDKASSDESISRESRILFISQASALRIAIWSVKKGQEANKR